MLAVVTATKQQHHRQDGKGWASSPAVCTSSSLNSPCAADLLSGPALEELTWGCQSRGQVNCSDSPVLKRSKCSVEAPYLQSLSRFQTVTRRRFCSSSSYTRLQEAEGQPMSTLCPADLSIGCLYGHGTHTLLEARYSPLPTQALQHHPS